VEPGGRRKTPIRWLEALAPKGLKSSMGSVADAYNRGAAETVISALMVEAIAITPRFRSGPLKGLADVDEIPFD
jgi:putative transposase